MMNGTATVILHLNQQERVSSKSQMLIMVKRIKNMSELKELFSDAGNKLVVVEFSAKWCGPCKTIAPVFQAMSLKYQNVTFAQVDVDSSKELAEHCDITMLPTFQMFKYTQKIFECHGADAKQLEKKIQELM
eukprot:XP_006538264.1 PREDICTED: thioredoxin domain-containing protein 8 isoform X1 [Mus musculus]